MFSYLTSTGDVPSCHRIAILWVLKGAIDAMQGLAVQGLSKLVIRPPFFSMMKAVEVDWDGLSLLPTPDTTERPAYAGNPIECTCVGTEH